ncbi:MAG: peptidoglycan-binding domain-containing protein, partial [Patescibacteria group bacterium]
MRRGFIVLLLAFLFVPVLADAQSVSSASVMLNRPLSVGSKGDDVSYLQTFLKAKNYFTYPTITGFYGSMTKNAVAAFQKDNGLEQVGNVGPLTRALINNTSGSSNSSNTKPSSEMSPTTPWWYPSAIPGGYTPGFGGGGPTTPA